MPLYFSALFWFCLNTLFWRCCLDSSLDWSPLHPQKWYSKSNQDERCGFCLSWHALSTWILTWKDFLDLQRWLGRARSNSFSTFELWLPKDEDKIMSAVLSVKVSRDSIALTTTTDAPEKRICREQQVRPQLRKGQGTTYKVCGEDLALGSDPATGKNLSIGNQLPRLAFIFGSLPLCWNCSLLVN